MIQIVESGLPIYWKEQINSHVAQLHDNFEKIVEHEEIKFVFICIYMTHTFI